MKYIIADDHAGVRSMIRFLIAAPGDEIMECSSADEAVQIAAEFAPDCVTMDIRMPGLCSFAATRTILKAYDRTRVIIVTSYDHADLRRTAFDSGASEYVIKDDLVGLPDVLSRVMHARAPMMKNEGGNCHHE